MVCYGTRLVPLGAVASVWGLVCECVWPPGNRLLTCYMTVWATDVLQSVNRHGGLIDNWGQVLGGAKKIKPAVTIIVTRQGHNVTFIVVFHAKVLLRIKV